ncbi:hypothetical protein BBM00_00405 [Vibrio parahaemolyticus]|uniref:hypothetical protein n=1 Tax=Vibrio parahaemolyticus TaxID=670 RepID=UPI00084A3919|nr:hypothetical protein [Vibrio parahaemolyticus]ODX26336.1 hypothetical protein BBM00_00405 [Vibrio parahaemolyticus]
MLRCTNKEMRKLPLFKNLANTFGARKAKRLFGLAECYVSFVPTVALLSFALSWGDTHEGFAYWHHLDTQVRKRCDYELTLTL